MDDSSLEREVTLLCRNKYLSLVLLGLVLSSSSASAQGETSDMVKELIPYGDQLTIAFVAFLVAFVGLVVWEIVEQKNSSRSSLDIAKLAAAAQKKKPKASAPSGAVGGESSAPAGRPFAPPPPPPPPKAQPSQSSSASPSEPTGASASSEGSSPFASSSEQSSPFAPSTEGSSPFGPPPTQNANPLSAPAGNPGFDATVAFSPQDAGSSGGWADLLQRVRAGEPEAASFEGGAPTPTTEEESGTFSPPSPMGSADSPAASFAPTDFTPSAPSAPPASSSSEAWEALLKRTTGGDGGVAGASGDDSKKVSLNSSFGSPSDSLGVDPPSTAPYSSGIEFVTPTDASPISDSFSLGGSGETQAPSPFGSSEDKPFGGPQSESPASPFSTSPGAAPSFSIGSSGEDSPPTPSFSLPKDDSSSPSSSFKLPGTDAPAANPFGGGAIDPPSTSNTMPLADLFGGAGADPDSTPAFQLPPSGSAPTMDFLGSSDGAGSGGRTISLDFSGGGGQTPPAPLPKTEG